MKKRKFQGTVVVCKTINDEASKVFPSPLAKLIVEYLYYIDFSRGQQCELWNEETEKCEVTTIIQVTIAKVSLYLYSPKQRRKVIKVAKTHEYLVPLGYGAETL